MPSKKHWSPSDTETSFIWQSTYNHQRIFDYDDQPRDVKAKFYDDLIVLFLQHPSDKVIILGDLNARVGTDYQA